MSGVRFTTPARYACPAQALCPAFGADLGPAAPLPVALPPRRSGRRNAGSERLQRNLPQPDALAPGQAICQRPMRRTTTPVPRPSSAPAHPSQSHPPPSYPAGTNRIRGHPSPGKTKKTHAPVKGATNVKDVISKWVTFRSTPPLGGDPQPSSRPQPVPVSIHAPVRGRPRWSWSGFSEMRVFRSTPP